MFIDETSLTTRKIARTFSRRRRLSTIGAKVSEVELDRGPIMSMSALGQKQTFAVQTGMSALPPIATAKANIGLSDFIGVHLISAQVCSNRFLDRKITSNHSRH